MKPRLIAVALAAATASALLVACQRSTPEDTAGAPPESTASTPAAAPAPATGSAAAAPTDLEQLAERLVTQSAAVKEGEIVYISGRSQDAELLDIPIDLDFGLPGLGLEVDGSVLLRGTPQGLEVRGAVLERGEAGITFVVPRR